VEKLNTKTVPKGYSQWGEVDGIYITEAYVDSYPWANPFVGLSEYYGKEITASSGDPIRVNLAAVVSVRPGDKPLDTWVQCESYPGFTLEKASASEGFSHFLWGFRDLKKLTQPVPSEPDKVNISISAKRLAVFPNGGVTVEHVADDAALSALKRQYKKDPVALINGDYKSTDGTSFEFTGGAALLSPSVTATWGSGGRLVIHKNGTVEQSGVSLSAPTFKFYQPTSGADGKLDISLTRDGFTFGIAPENNAVQLQLKGVALLALEGIDLALDLGKLQRQHFFGVNVFDLFETEAKLALERVNDGSLIPDELWFFVKSEPGILLIPPVPVGRLTGGGAGFKDLAATVNGNYFAIPPIKLRGAVSGAYLQLVEDRADVVLGPSEISLKASDVGIMGFGKYGQFVDSFGYALKLTGQERNYKGTPYQGVYLIGSGGTDDQSAEQKPRRVRFGVLP